MTESKVIENGVEYTVKIDDNGTKHWYHNGQRHREDGPASEYASGCKLWFLNDQLHREDGPAIERVDGCKLWFLNYVLHREDGPACEFSNGDKYWFINGGELTKEEFNKRTN